MLDEQQMALASGIAAFESKQFSRALQLLTPHAQIGNPDAQHRLAVMYQNGLGLVRNEASAYRWMKCAADQDHGLALHALGYMYLDGDCTDQHDQKAVACFEKAVDLGLEGSMLALAQMYQQGRGVVQDSNKARLLYVQAGFDPAELISHI
jgi:TPR repeat protein